MLRIFQSVFKQLRRNAEAAYPKECCGVLLGLIGADSLVVKNAVAVRNGSDSPANRYAIDPGQVVRAMREAREANLDVVGFYHSHPDQAADWSATDLAEAHWLGCCYMITSVMGGESAETRCFRLEGMSEENKRFAEELVVMVEP